MRQRFPFNHTPKSTRSSPKRRGISCALAFLVLGAVGGRASARERIAVLILPDDERDRGLADNLTEVAIARLAEISDSELVGGPELRRRLQLAGGADLPAGCLNEAACLGRVGIMAGVHRLVSGSVRSDNTGFLLALALNDIQTGKVDRTFFRAVTGDLDTLIRTIQDGVNDLFQRRSVAGQLRVDSIPDGASVTVDEIQRGTTPLWIKPLDPGNHRLRIEMSGRFALKRDLVLHPGQTLLVSVHRDELPARHLWAPYAAYGTAAAAVLSFATAALFGTLAQGDVTGATRRQAEMDLEVKRGHATIANVLLVTGGVLSIASAFTFVRFRHDIGGE